MKKERAKNEEMDHVFEHRENRIYKLRSLPMIENLDMRNKQMSYIDPQMALVVRNQYEHLLAFDILVLLVLLDYQLNWVGRRRAGIRQ